MDVKIYDNLEPSSEEAARAEEQYGIRPARVLVRERGTMQEKDLYMGAAFTCGLEKVVVPFFDQGIPVEYELVRSITTVAQAKRKRLGVVSTDAQLFGGFDMQRMSQTPKQLIVEELEKQYEVVQIDPSSPIQEQVDVLLAVQPSSLNPQQLDNFIEAVRKGTPTAIFEDPLPVMMNAPGTSQPKTPRGGMMGMGAPPEPKGEIQRLWDLLGVRLVGKERDGTVRGRCRLAGFQSLQESPRVPPDHQGMGVRLPRCAGCPGSTQLEGRHDRKAFRSCCCCFPAPSNRANDPA